MRRTFILPLFFSAAALSAVAAGDTVAYDVAPVKTSPATAAEVSAPARIRLVMKRGFGTVGYDKSADGVKVYLEDAAGHRIMLKNAIEMAPDIDDSWNLELMNDATEKGVSAYKDKLYNRLFTRTLGWNGGDGVFTVELPGGHTFWTFNDSFYGVADAETRARGACSFPRNTIMVQRADADGYPITTDEALIWLAKFKQTTDSSAPGYYKAVTHLDHPEAKSRNDDGIAQDKVYWSGDGTVTADGKLKMLWNGVDTANGLKALGTAVAVYNLEGEPGDDSYLKIKSVDHTFLYNNPYAYGSTLWEDADGHIYLYSSVNNGEWLGNVPIVGRTVGTELDGRWEYYYPDENGNMQWHTKYPTEAQVQKSGIAPKMGSLTLPWVFKKGDYYFMCAQTFPFGSEMVIMRSEHPWGPFSEKHTLIRFPNPLDELQHDPWGNEYRFLYMLNLHPALSRFGELVISTNTDAKDDGPGSFWRNFNNPGSCDWYRPFYYRVYGWEKLFDNTPKGASDCIEFVPTDETATLAPGSYTFVCEQGVFGDETFETSGYSEGRSNGRIEIPFTVTPDAGIDEVKAATVESAKSYHTMQGVRVASPESGSVYVVSTSEGASKQLVR